MICRLTMEINKKVKILEKFKLIIIDDLYLKIIKNMLAFSPS